MSQPKYSTHHGMTDILPDDVKKWQYLEQLIRTEAELFIFEEICTPILEQTELIVHRLSQISAIVSKDVFSFSRGDDHYVLRPQLTAPVVRCYVPHHLNPPGGAHKPNYTGHMFRAESTQRGRQR